MERFISLIGIFVLLGLAWLFSTNRKAVNWRLVGSGIALQMVFAILVLKTPPGRWLFAWFNDAITALLGFTHDGSEFLFGGEATFSTFFSFATHVLPTIIFFSALMSIMYYLGVMQFIVEIVAKVIVRVLGTSGAETLSCSANIFVGQTEAPLLIKPYVEQMTNSELMTVMVGGFATVAGGVMAAYVGMLADSFPDIAGHLMAASVMAAPGAIVISKIMVPETEEPATKGHVGIDVPVTEANVIEAAANGASVGLQLALNVGAMLLAFLAIVAMLNGGLSAIGYMVGYPEISIQYLLGLLFSPLAFVMGVPWKDAHVVGELLGTKIAVNEFVAYGRLDTLLGLPTTNLDPRSVMIATYALCGFANLGSIGIQIGGIGGIAPSRRSDLARLGFRAMMAGFMASCLVASVAGLLVGPGEVELKHVPGAAPQAPAPPPEGFRLDRLEVLAGGDHPVVQVH